MTTIPADTLQAMTLAEIRAVLDLGPEELVPWIDEHESTSATLDEAARALRCGDE